MEENENNNIETKLDNNNTEMQVNDLSTNEVTIKPNKNGNKVLIVILIILLLILGLVTYKVFVLDKKTNKEVSNSEKGNGINSNSMEENITTDEPKVDESDNSTVDGEKVIYLYSTVVDKRTLYSCDDSYNDGKKIEFKCNTNCKCVDVAKNYVLIDEDNKYSLYDYTNNKKIINDFADGFVFDDDSEDYTFKPTIETDFDGNPIALIYYKDWFSKIYSFL